MSEMYENMYGIPMDDDDMDMDMEPMNEEEFRATVNGHNGSNLDIIHEKPDDEVDASGSRGEASKSGSGKHESPQDGGKGEKADTKSKKPPKKPNGNGNHEQVEISKKNSESKRKDSASKRAESGHKRPSSASRKAVLSPTRLNGGDPSLKLSGKRDSSSKRQKEEGSSMKKMQKSPTRAQIPLQRRPGKEDSIVSDLLRQELVNDGFIPNQNEIN